VQHVEILMATRNGADHLAEQLESLVAQTHRHWHLRLSDDGSTDATRTIAAGFVQPDGRPPRILDGPQAGSAAANFLSLLTAPDLPDGIPVALADQDDVWFPDRLERGLAALAAAGGTGPLLFCSATSLTDAALRPIGPSRRHRRFGFRNALVQNVVAGNTMLLNPAAVALVRAAGPVNVPHHDWWLYLLVTAAGGRILYDPRPTAFYRQHGGNELGENRSMAARRRRARMVSEGTWTRWVNANLAALRGAEALIEPRWQTALHDAGDLTRDGSALARAGWLRRLRPYRQTAAETAALYAAILAGRI
jgi:glycosyltransferase involved in cell wall biosynthesis